MSSIRLAGVWAVAVATLCASLVRAEDISAKKVDIKDHLTDPAKRQLQVQSGDLGVQFSEADDPGTNGAALHVYSATDDFCVILPGGIDWKLKGTSWKYKSKTTKNAAQVKDAKLQVKIKSGVTYTLADDGTQGPVNVQVQFGGGTRYCMRCTGNKKNEATKFLGTECAAAPCDPEPSSCAPVVTTTTTTTSAPTTTTSTTLVAGVVLQGVLPATTGRFNYNLVVGLPGANSACSSTFAGTHACTYADLLSAEAAGDLDGIKDTTNMTVTSFWAIDGTHPDTLQCTVTVAWDYATAHTGQFAEKVNLTNATGVLGPLMSGAGQGVFCAGSSWVGCCL